MKDSIRLHPKHGLNPTIPVCYWCGADKNEVALLGAAYESEAPMHMLLDYVPCDACMAQRALGITLMEATRTPNVKGQWHVHPEVYPTGRWAVLKEDAAMRLLEGPMLSGVLKHRKAYIEPDAWEQLGLNAIARED